MIFSFSCGGATVENGVGNGNLHATTNQIILRCNRQTLLSLSLSLFLSIVPSPRCCTEHHSIQFDCLVIQISSSNLALDDDDFDIGGGGGGGIVVVVDIVGDTTFHSIPLQSLFDCLYLPRCMYSCTHTACC